MSDHEHAEHGKKEFKNPQYKVPLAVPIIIVLVLISLFMLHTWLPTF